MNHRANDAFDALMSLDPGMPREQWVRVCFGFKDAGGTEDEWITWCSGGGNFNRADAISTYRNAKPMAGGITSATLFMLAHDAGYRPHHAPDNGKGGTPPQRNPVAPPYSSVSTQDEAPAPAAPAQPTDPVPVWNACSVVHVHPYTSRKGVKLHGCRQSTAGWLVVPYYHRERALQTLQMIASDGTKRFLAGAKQKGSVAILGEPQGAATVVVVEGFATGAAVHEATGLAVLCSGSRGTMPEAAKMARYFSPMGRVVIAADRGDLATPLAAARGVAGFLCVPGPDDAPDGFDFCDWRQVSGVSDTDLAARIEHAPTVPAEEPAPALLTAARSAVTDTGPPPEPPADGVEENPYLLDGKARPLANLANLFTFLTSGATGELKRDTFTGVVTWRGAPVSDGTYLAITRTLQHSTLNARRPFNKVAVSMVMDAVHLAAEANSYNSCTEWLESLPAWDGVERLPRFFCDVADLEATDYVQAVSRYFWLGMVSRMMSPGAQVDQSLTLVGPQGIGKSSLARIVGGERYGTVGLAEIGGKDWYVQLRGKIVVEISELAGHSRAELETLKAVLTHTHDEYRIAYARSHHTVPRGCVFLATTNERDFLQDASGNRRWLPLQCSAPFNLDTARAMREACFSEAYHHVCAGLTPTWWAIPNAADVQAAHLARDPWIDLLDEKLRSITGVLPERVTNTAVYEALKIPAERQTGPTGRRLAHAMAALNFARAKWYVDARQVRGYERTAASPP